MSNNDVRIPLRAYSMPSGNNQPRYSSHNSNNTNVMAQRTPLPQHQHQQHVGGRVLRAPKKEEPAWPGDSLPPRVYNHTKDLLQDWNWRTGLFYFLSEIIGVLFFTFAVGSAAVLFPGGGVPGLIRSFIVAFAVFIPVLAWGRWTGSYLSPWISFWNTLLYFAIERDERMSALREVAKLFIFWTAQFLGAFAGFAAVGIWFGLPVPASFGWGVPVVATFGVTSAHWMEAFGALFVYCAYSISHGLYDDREKNHFLKPLLVAAAWFVVTLLFGPFTGTPLNLYNWLIPAIYSGTTSINPSVYTWPALLGSGVVFLFELFYYWVLRRRMRQQ